MDDEPFTKRKLRSYDVRVWELREGRMTLTLDAMTSSYRFIPAAR
jgi:hypothetical protein